MKVKNEGERLKQVVPIHAVDIQRAPAATGDAGAAFARYATPLESSTISATIVVLMIRFTPPTPRPPRLEHVRDLWQMHRPHRPQAILTAAIFQTDTGLELRIGFSLTNLIHSQLSRTGDDALLERAEDLRQVLIEQGWIELMAPATTQ
jgi:hypothetical protein